MVLRVVFFQSGWVSHGLRKLLERPCTVWGLCFSNVNFFRTYSCLDLQNLQVHACRAFCWASFLAVRPTFRAWQNFDLYREERTSTASHGIAHFPRSDCGTSTVAARTGCCALRGAELTFPCGFLIVRISIRSSAVPKVMKHKTFVPSELAHRSKLKVHGLQ